MSSLKSLLAGGAGALLLTGRAAPQTLSISGVVDTTDGKPLPHVEIRVVTVGGTVTSDSGEFSIALPPQFEPGVPLLLSVRDWVIIDPYDGESGETYVRKRSTDLVTVVVGRKGDRKLLSDARLIQQIVQGVASQLEPRPGSAANSDVFLADQAAQLGFTLDQLKSAINDWSKNVQEPYQKGLAALYARRFAEASEYIHESLNSPENDLVSKYVLLSVAEIAQAHYAVAEAVLLKAHAIRNEDATVLNDLGLVFTHEAKYAEAERCLKSALAIDERALGPEHRNVAPSLNNLGQLYYAEGEYANAEPLDKQALFIDEKALGPEHPKVAIDLDNLAVLYAAESRYAEAEPLYTKALAIEAKALGPMHRKVAQFLMNLATLYVAEGNYTEAERRYRLALTIEEKATGREDPHIAGAFNNLAAIYEAQHKYEEAEPLLKQGVAIDEKAFGSQHVEVAIDLNNLATLYKEQGKYSEAEPLYQRAAAIGKKALGAEHGLVAMFLSNLADLYRTEGKYAEAEPLYEKALVIDEKALGPEQPSVAAVEENLAATLRKLGRDTEATTYEDQAAKIRARMNQK